MGWFVEKDGVKQVANDQFEVAYDPTGTTPAAFAAPSKKWAMARPPEPPVY
jgi:hypothetical protein